LHITFLVSVRTVGCRNWGGDAREGVNCEDIGRGGPNIEAVWALEASFQHVPYVKEMSKTPWTLFRGTGAGTERRETVIEMNDMLWNMR
jgi:hypothetical protein